MDYVYILSIVCCGALFFVNRDNKRYIADLHTRVKNLELAEHWRHHNERLKNNIDIHNEEIELFKSKEKLNSKSAFFWWGGSTFVIFFIVINIVDPNHATEGLTIFGDLFLSIIFGFAGMVIRNINNTGYFKLEIKELENNNISINKDLKELIESIDKIEKKVDYNIKKINTLKNKMIAQVINFLKIRNKNH